MMSLASIRELSREAAAKAARTNRKPIVIENDDLVSFDDFVRFIKWAPFIGDFVHDEWEMTDTLFVDSSGFGSEHEPALTHRQLYTVAKENGAGIGYAIIETGQFQLYLGVYKKKE